MMSVRSLRWHGVDDARLVNEPARPVESTEVAIAPLAVGVCGTDAHIMTGDFAAEPGIVLGHEVCGRVVDIGASVDALAVGDLVTVEPHRYCGACAYCRAGSEHLCVHKAGYGVRLDGGMTDRMVLPARIGYRLPPETPPWIGAMTEPVACCVHAMDRLDATSGTPVLVYGCGPAGAVLVALARLQGLAPIVVMDPLPDRRDLALRMGADLVLDPTASDSEARASEAAGDLGFQSVIDAVGSGRVLESAIRVAADGARILVFGVASGRDSAQISPYEVYRRELSIIGSVINPYTHQRAVALLPRLGLDRLRPAFYGIDRFADALEEQARGDADKVFMTPFHDTGGLTRCT